MYYYIAQDTPLPPAAGDPLGGQSSEPHFPLPPCLQVLFWELRRLSCVPTDRATQPLTTGVPKEWNLMWSLKVVWIGVEFATSRGFERWPCETKRVTSEKRGT